VTVSTNQEHQQHQEIEGYPSRASRASETAYKTKIHQQPPPDRRQKCHYNFQFLAVEKATYKAPN